MADAAQSGWWYLSFVDRGLPEGERFLGGAVVRGADMEGAVRNAWALGCNPGGEVLGLGILEGRLPSEPWRERLLTKGEALELVAWSEARWGGGGENG